MALQLNEKEMKQIKHNDEQLNNTGRKPNKKQWMQEKQVKVQRTSLILQMILPKISWLHVDLRDPKTELKNKADEYVM